MHHDIRYRHAGGDPLIVGRWFDRPTDTPTDGILGHGQDAYQTCRSLVWLFVDVRPGFFLLVCFTSLVQYLGTYISFCLCLRRVLFPYFGRLVGWSVDAIVWT